ncbi:MAG: hypothetical protein ACFCBU_08150, partial [Cyanophyceae cyanobacterium]
MGAQKGRSQQQNKPKSQPELGTNSLTQYFAQYLNKFLAGEWRVQGQRLDGMPQWQWSGKLLGAIALGIAFFHGVLAYLLGQGLLTSRQSDLSPSGGQRRIPVALVPGSQRLPPPEKPTSAPSKPSVPVSSASPNPAPSPLASQSLAQRAIASSPSPSRPNGGPQSRAIPAPSLRPSPSPTPRLSPTPVPTPAPSLTPVPTPTPQPTPIPTTKPTPKPTTTPQPTPTPQPPP